MHSPLSSRTLWMEKLWSLSSWPWSPRITRLKFSFPKVVVSLSQIRANSSPTWLIALRFFSGSTPLLCLEQSSSAKCRSIRSGLYVSKMSKEASMVNLSISLFMKEHPSQICLLNILCPSIELTASYFFIQSFPAGGHISPIR